MIVDSRSVDDHGSRTLTDHGRSLVTDGTRSINDHGALTIKDRLEAAQGSIEGHGRSKIRKSIDNAVKDSIKLGDGALLNDSQHWRRSEPELVDILVIGNTGQWSITGRSVDRYCDVQQLDIDASGRQAICRSIVDQSIAIPAKRFL